MVKVPTGYGILIVMISLSPLGLRARGVLMETVDAYYGKSFLFGKPRVVGTFFQRTCLQWHIQQHRVFTSRVFQICIFFSVT